MVLCVLYDKATPLISRSNVICHVAFFLLLVPSAFKIVSDVSVNAYSNVYAN